jgi:hypothetical protein
VNFVNAKIPPEKVLRGIALFCLVAMGIAAICRMKYPGYDTPYGSRFFDATTYFFFAFVLFGLFYGQYVWIPRLLRRRLNAALGFVQTFLCFALLLFGLFPVWIVNMGAPALFNTDNMAVTIAILGEALFVVNVCWTLLQPESAVALVPAAQARPLTPAPLQTELKPIPRLQAQKKARSDFSMWLKPQNPVEKFGVSAIFLFLGGMVIFLVMPDSRFLILWGGQKHFLAMGFLWLMGAIPFGVFSLAYWFHAGRKSVPYDNWMTKVHLGLMFAWLIDFVRIVVMAQVSMLSRLPDLAMDSYTFELYVLLGAAIAMFFVNIRATTRAAAK